MEVGRGNGQTIDRRRFFFSYSDKQIINQLTSMTQSDIICTIPLLLMKQKGQEGSSKDVDETQSGTSRTSKLASNKTNNLNKNFKQQLQQLP